MGLHHAELMLATEATYDAHQAGGAPLPYIVALEALDDHLGSVYQRNIGNLATLILREPLWNREAAAKLIAPGVE